ncbi:MAG: hypothetical protein KDD45_12740, partial [Bdellovibrionales bacterium]|nr:hypothetical protein [Bdellovibrionales bacterium]
MKTTFLKLALSVLISSSLFAPSQAEANILGSFRNLFGSQRPTSAPISTPQHPTRVSIVRAISSVGTTENVVPKSNKCLELYKTSQVQSKLNNSSKKMEPNEVSDLKSFGQAMTEGMLLNAEQADLFEVYRKIYFGDPNTSVNNETLKSVTAILKKYPDLQKPHFREYEISTVEKV